MSAVASYLDAHSRGQPWRVRIEDIDPPREVAGSAASILSDLRRFGLEPDGMVLHQSTRTEAFREAERRLLDAGKAFWCGCSRAELPASGIYPGTCREGLPPGKKARALRLKVDDRAIRFTDLIQGEVRENLMERVGDFVIRRADGYPAYQLAVVVDDAYQGIDRVVRGVDLLDSTARQIWLQQCLSLPTPEYAHVPLVTGPDGRKLSKQARSDPVNAMSVSDALKLALKFLGQDAGQATGARELLEAATANWRLDHVPRVGSDIPAFAVSG